ncbi:relaxase domain-containing protein [Streptomyces sp. R28]|uniref:Relaxase domain-containing protein n=1 Tax=Streptomyces sp. R28 TaxID=3238628 RepID=A0AB39QFE6_9ACTN
MAKALRWLEDEVAETRWSSGRGRAKSPALVLPAFRHFDNRDGFPLLHDHCLLLNRVQGPDDDGEPVVGSHFPMSLSHGRSPFSGPGDRGMRRAPV